MTDEKLNSLLDKMAVDEGGKQELFGAANRGTKFNPDQYAEAMKLGRDTGITPPAVLRNIQQYQQDAKAKLVSSLYGTPAGTWAISHPDNTVLAQDAAHELHSTQIAVDGMPEGTTPGQAAVIRDARAELARENAQRSGTLGSVGVELWKPVSEAIGGVLNLGHSLVQGVDAKISGAFGVTPAVTEDSPLHSLSKWLQAGSERGRLAPQQTLTDPDTGKPFANPDASVTGIHGLDKAVFNREMWNDVLHVPGELMKMITLNKVFASMGVANPQQSTAFVFGAKAGFDTQKMAYLRRKQLGLPDNPGLDALEGTLSAATTFVLMNNIPGAASTANLASDWAGNPTKVLLRDSLTTPTKTITGDIAQKVGRAAILGPSIQMVGNVGQALHGDQVDVTQDLLKAAVGFIPWEAVGTVERMTAVAKDSVLNKRSQAKFEEVTKAQLEGSGLETSQIKASDLVSYFQSKGLDAEKQVEKLFGTSADEFRIAVRAGGDIEIPMEKFLARVAPGEHADAIVKMLRVGGNDSTVQDIKTQVAVATETANTMREIQTLPTTDPERDLLRDKIAAELTSATRVFTPGQAKEIADFQAKVYTVQAKRVGMTPTELFESRKVSFVRDTHDTLDRLQGVDHGLTDRSNGTGTAAEVPNAAAGRISPLLRPGAGEVHGRSLAASEAARTLTNPEVRFAQGVIPTPITWVGSPENYGAVRAENRASEPALGSMGPGAHVSAGPEVGIKYTDGNPDGLYKVGLKSTYIPFDASTEKMYSVEEAAKLGFKTDGPLSGNDLWMHSVAAIGMKETVAKLQSHGFGGLYYNHGGEDAWSIWKDEHIHGSRPTTKEQAAVDYARQGSRRDSLTGELKMAQPVQLFQATERVASRTARKIILQDPSIKLAGFTKAMKAELGADAKGLDFKKLRELGQTKEIPGAPPAIRDEAGVMELEQKLLDMARAGEAGKYFYRDSEEGFHILGGGDSLLALKYAASAGLYSPSDGVLSNAIHAVRAGEQSWAGLQIDAGRYPNAKREAAQRIWNAKTQEEVMSVLNSQKVLPFMQSLITQLLHPELAGDLNPVIDMHMMRAGGYENEAPSTAQSLFMQQRVRNVAKALGWKNEEAQAAIWATQKAITDKTNIETSSADFFKGFKKRTGSVTVEAVPGSSVRDQIFPGFQANATPQDIAAFTKEKVDLLVRAAHEAGYPITHEQFGQGYWDNASNPAASVHVVLPAAKGGETSHALDPGAARTVRELAKLFGSILNDGGVSEQEGIGWNRPFHDDPTLETKNAQRVQLTRMPTPEEIIKLGKGLDSIAITDKDGKPILNGKGKPIIGVSYPDASSEPNAIRIITPAWSEGWGAVTGMKFNEDGTPFEHSKEERSAQSKMASAYHVKIGELVKSVFGADAPKELGLYHSQGELIERGEYENGNVAAGPSHLQGRDLATWRSENAAINERYRTEKGWGSDAAGSPGARSVPEFVGRPAPPDAVSAQGVHYSTGSNLATLRSDYRNGTVSGETERLRDIEKHDPDLISLLDRKQFYLLGDHAKEGVVQGGNRYEAVIHGLLDTNPDSPTRPVAEALWAKAKEIASKKNWAGAYVGNQFEKLVIDAGYNGTLTGRVITVLGHKEIPVRPFAPDIEGPTAGVTKITTGQEPTQFYQPVYHGSPFKFDKFTLDHIGKGEGAQAYGWGLYFAGSKGIAAWYHENLARTTQAHNTIDGKRITKGLLGKLKKDANPFVRDFFDHSGGVHAAGIRNIMKSLEGSIEEALDNAGHFRQREQDRKNPNIVASTYTSEEMAKQADWFERKAAGLQELKARLGYNNASKGGQLYQVDIPGDSEMLHYDKPFSEQPESVKASLVAMGAETIKTPKWVDMGAWGLSNGPFVIKQNEDGTYRFTTVISGTFNTLDEAKAAAAERNPETVAPRDLTGNEIYYRLSKALGSDKAASLALNDAGISGVKYLDGTSRAPGARESFNYVVFDDKSTNVLETYYQPGQGENRGMISFTPGKDGHPRQFPITLFKNENRSTVFHELGHFYLELLGDMSEMTTAEASVKADYQTVLKWMGVKDRSEIGTQHHEQFADTWLKYLESGKAPTPELVSPLRKFTSWLRKIGAQLIQADAPLSDDMRGVFDRLIASDKEIEAARAENATRDFTQEQLGMNDAQYVSYSKLVKDGTASALENLTTTVMREMGRQEKTAYKELLAKTREEVDAAILKMPEFEALVALGEIPTKADPNNMVHSLVAEEYGVDINALLKQRKALSDRQVAQQMDQAYPSLLNDPAALREAAIKELNGNQLERKLAEELKAFRAAERKARPVVDQALKDQMGEQRAAAGDRQTLTEEQQRIQREQANLDKAGQNEALVMPKIASFRIAASAYISNEAPWKIRPDLILNTQRRAAQEAYAAALKNDYAGAAKAKEQEILNHFLYKEAVLAREESEKIYRYGRDGQKTPFQAKLGLAGGEFQAQWNELANRYEFARIPNTEIVARQQELAAWVKQMQDADEPIDIDPSLFAAKPRNWREVPMNELRAVNDALKNIEHVAQQQLEMTIEGRRYNFAEERASLDKVARENLSKKPNPVGGATETLREKASKPLQDFNAYMTKIEWIIDQIDGGDINGPARKNIKHLIDEAAGREKQMGDDIKVKLLDAFKDMTRADRTHETDSIGIQFPTMDRPMSRHQLVSWALNLGTEENRKIALDGWGLRKPVLDESGKQAKDAEGKLVYEDSPLVKEALGKLTTNEANRVQAIWDALESMRPEIAAKERRMKGVEPKWKKLTPFTVTTADGQTIEMRGGYFPQVADRTRSHVGETQADTETTGIASIRPTTSTSHTQAVTGAIYPALLDYASVLSKHLPAVIKDTTAGEAVRYVSKFLTHDEVKATLRETAGATKYNEFVPWLKSYTTNGVDTAHDGGPILRFLMNRRLGMVIARLGGNLTSYVVQGGDSLKLTADPTTSNPKFLAVHYPQAIYDIRRNPTKMIEEIRNLSPNEMRFREENFNREMLDIIKSKGPMDEKKQMVADFVMRGFAVMDRLQTFPAWLAMYRQGMDTHGVETQAVMEADRLIARSFQAGEGRNMARMMRDTGWTKLITTFGGDASTWYGLVGSAFESKKVLRVSTALMALVAEQMMAATIRKGLPEKDNIGDWTIDQVVTALLNPLGWFGDAAQYGVNKAQGKFAKFNNPTMDAIEKAVVAPVGVWKTITGEQDDPEKTLIDVTEAAGLWMGIPGTGQLIKSWKYQHGIRTGTQETPDNVVQNVQRTALGPPPKAK